MPQVDLSSIYSGGVLPDRKVYCETLASAGTGTDPPDPMEDHPSDYAPESFWLSKDAELDWLDRNAFIERKDSGKGSTNPNPNSNSNNISHGISPKSSSISGSQRYSIIGLPKPQKTNYAEARNRRTCRPTSIRLLPERSEPVPGKSANIALSEPDSPKVSCMGRIRSRKKQNEPGLASRGIKESKTGFWRNLRFIFGSKADKTGCKGNKGVVEPVASKKKRDPRDRKPNPVEPPGLGAMNRFVSGRRSDGWAAELEVNEEKCEPLDHGLILQWRKGEPGDVGVVDRDWQSVGPPSV